MSNCNALIITCVVDEKIDHLFLLMLMCALIFDTVFQKRMFLLHKIIRKVFFECNRDPYFLDRSLRTLKLNFF
jgi:hypothetical protein